MKRTLLEESVLFISIFKWFFLATVVGIFVGSSTAIFLKALEIGTLLTGQYTYYFIMLPAAFFLSSLTIKYLAPEAEGHGTEKVIEAVHKRSGKINPMVVPIKLVATIITISFGGSAGKEGPCAQIGAGISSVISGLLKFNNQDRKKLVICGISAGFATVFGTPIAGAIFGVEVLFVGGLLYDVLFPSFVAGIVGYQAATMLGITYFHQPLQFVPMFSSLLFVKVCLSGIFFGLCAFVFIQLMKKMEQLKKKLKMWEPYKGLIGGAALVMLVFLFSERFLGLGLDTISSALEGRDLNPLIFLGKMLFTSITLSFGGSGGIVTPIFFIGATSGNAFANIFGLDVAMFSAIGMVAVLAGAANTPISASIMAVELFGPAVAPYAAVACVISYLMTGHRSVYPSQVLAVTKSPSIFVEKGVEMEQMDSLQIKPRPRSIIGLILNIFRKLESLMSKDKTK
ncbi:MAG TPA: voltage-gated chloride channel [Nitrospirae bacterium]|nr:H(+)/Cl(-) exchange transporter ClcA [bacterium BMS3Abin10]GBE39086.1 H(+)/Cl(-) exchange transporter ClcA [bacterium BMS3Bbin08]HDH50179.1 voltage-gated chloride channel [Nitrospirota bacterium]HDK41663.1 voltage-gated chloride channel [Nitrospirota bacterium]HDZ84127.1 voltage-gated chloride channel [Nitrospirota bacterium]